MSAALENVKSGAAQTESSMLFNQSITQTLWNQVGVYQCTRQPLDHCYWNLSDAKVHGFVTEVQVRAYVKTVLQDKDFQRNPRQFLCEWSKRRQDDHSKGIDRYPQDFALDFFLVNRSLLFSNRLLASTKDAEVIA